MRPDWTSRIISIISIVISSIVIAINSPKVWPKIIQLLEEMKR